MATQQDETNIIGVLNILGPLLCWADGELDEEELNAANEIGSQLFKTWNGIIFRSFVEAIDGDNIAKLTSDDVMFLIEGLLEQEQIADLEVDGKKAILTFLTAVAMADGKYHKKESEIIDGVAKVFGFQDQLVEPSAKELKAAKKQSTKKLLTVIPLMGKKEQTTLLAIVRGMNPNATMSDFKLIYDDVSNFIHRGIYRDILLAKEKKGEKIEKSDMSDFELIKKSKNQKNSADIDFGKFLVLLMQDDFDWIRGLADIKFARVISALTQIFYLHALRSQRNDAIGSSEKSFRKPNVKNSFYLDEFLKEGYGWNQNAFSNGFGQIDIIKGRAGLRPHTSFLKKLFNRSKGVPISLEEILISEKTVIKFMPERLVSNFHNKDVNFWLSHLKNEAVFIGPEKIELDILGLPTTDLKPKEGVSLLNKDLLFISFLDPYAHTRMCVFDTVEKGLWSLPSIVFHGCGAIEISST